MTVKMHTPHRRILAVLGVLAMTTSLMTPAVADPPARGISSPPVSQPNSSPPAQPATTPQSPAAPAQRVYNGDSGDSDNQDWSNYQGLPSNQTDRRDDECRNLPNAGACAGRGYGSGR